jgi:hypothetical protein
VAQEDEEAIRLSYFASEGCPDQAAFIARVRVRTTKAQLVPAGTGAGEGRAFDVEVDAGHPAYGRLTVGNPEHPEGTRRVQAETCEDVVDALALMVALAIDPRVPASAATSSPPTPEAGPPSVAEATVPPPVAPAVTGPRLDPNRTSVARAALEDSPRGRSSDGNAQHVLMAGLDATLDVGVSPVTLVGLSASVGWQSRGAAPFSPALRAALDRAQSATLSLPKGTAAFTWTVGRLDACPVAGVLHSFRITACARIEVGMLDVAGGDIVGAQTKHRLWLSSGAFARGEWTFFEPLFLNVEAGANVRVTNDRFYFLPDTTVYQVPLVGLSAAGGLGAHFL